MKKLVNGKVIDINNLELFETAAEGAAINRTLPNIIPNDGLGINFSLMEEIIDIYKRFYASLPFPIYNLDSDMKYCSAGLLIKRELKIRNKMWVDNGLFICLDEARLLCIGFVNESWGIVKVKEIKPDNLSISSYKGHLGYDEFVWVVATLFKGEGTEGYYKVFMPQFVEACGNQAMVMRWELGNILKFADIPEKMTFEPNIIKDLDNKEEYTLDIYVAGRRTSAEKMQLWSMRTDDVQITDKKVNVYGYDLYKKSPYIENNKIGSDKLQITELFGINSLFCTICNIKLNSNRDEFDEYTGFIADNNLVYLVDSRLFIAKPRNYVDAKEIARGVEIYSYDNKYIYILKPKNIAPGIRKETIYSYNLEDNNLRLCKIQFSRV